MSASRIAARLVPMIGVAQQPSEAGSRAQFPTTSHSGAGAISIAVRSIARPAGCSGRPASAAIFRGGDSVRLRSNGPRSAAIGSTLSTALRASVDLADRRALLPRIDPNIGRKRA